MLNRITNFIKIPSFISSAVSSNKDKGKLGAEKEARVTAAKERFASLLSKTNVGAFFKDKSLTSSLRLFSKQINELTTQILTSKDIPIQQKKETLKTAIEQLKSALNGRQSLLQEIDLLQKAKMFVLHGKTVASLKSNLQNVEKQIDLLERELGKLEKEKAVSGKSLPQVPQRTFDKSTRLNVNEFVDRLLDPRYQTQMLSIKAILPSVYGVKNSCAALERALEQKISKSPNKDLAIKEAQQFIADFLKEIPPSELQSKENSEAFIKLIVSIYKHPEASKHETLVMACKLYFNTDRASFMAKLKSGENINGIDKTAYKALSDHTESLRHRDLLAGEINPFESISRPPTDFNRKLETLSQEKNNSRYQKMLKEVSLAFHEDVLDAFSSVKDYDIFDPATSEAARPTRVFEDKARLFILNPNITMKERSRRVEVLLDISKQLYDQKNYLAAANLFNVVFAMPTLNSIPVSSKHQEIKSILGKLVNADSNFKNYNQLVKNEKGFYVPLLMADFRNITQSRDFVKGQGNPSFENLNILATLRGNYFNRRNEAKEIGRKSPYSFTDPEGTRTTTEQTKTMAVQMGYSGVENLDDYQQFLRRKIKAQLDSQA